jgi:pyruvate, water dikinase
MNSFFTGMLVFCLFLSSCSVQHLVDEHTADKTIAISCIDKSDNRVIPDVCIVDRGQSFDVDVLYGGDVATTPIDGPLTIGYRATDDSMTLLIKATGYKTTQIRLNGLHDFPIDTTVALHMQSIPRIERTVDFCNGFSGNSGNAEFDSLSVHEKGEMGLVDLVKFYITWTGTDTSVYFQNTRKHPLHYDFAHEILGIALSRETFESVTYSGKDRQGLAGSILRYDSVSALISHNGSHCAMPYIVEFFTSDNLSPEQALIAYRLLEERMRFLPFKGETNRLYFLPASQARAGDLQAKQRLFAAAGALWANREDLYGSIKMQLLNRGTAYGTLRLLTAEQLNNTPLSIRDIPVLTSLPNDLPLVGGTITEELQTPLAHVNIAARNRGTPNMSLLNASIHPMVKPFLGKLVRFDVAQNGFSIAEATVEDAKRFWEERAPTEKLVPVFREGRDSLIAFSGLSFDDYPYIGVKAANLAELHSLIGASAPDGFAVPFAFYGQFIATAHLTEKLCAGACADCMSEGRDSSTCRMVRDAMLPLAANRLTISGLIDTLLGDNVFLTNSLFREASLDAIRYFFKHSDVDPQFASKLDNYAFAFFGNDTIRLRSSTNCEDLPRFSGAGLYNSVSAVIGGDDSPSKQIRKVWASLWSWTGCEERMYWNIDQKSVRMGVLVNRAFPHETINGVCITRNIADPSLDGIYLNAQKGEVSVTNPQPGELPEIVSLVMTNGGFSIIRQRYSSLSPDTSLLSDSEFMNLYTTARTVHDHFALLYNQNPWDAAFELEFKIDGPDRSLFIKQVRPYYDKNQ